MLPSLREDYLEAILLHVNKKGTPPSLHDIAQALNRTYGDVSLDIKELARAGDITLNADETIALTTAGEETGRQVIKKHETLQCFLTEILGMDTDAASNEACRIEHTISDETIDRLGSYLRTPFPEERPDGREPAGFRLRRRGAHDACGFAHSLVDFNEGEHLVVQNILGRACAKRLLDLGVVPGQEIIIRRKLKNQSIVVQVKGCDVALSPEIASAICVERLS